MNSVITAFLLTTLAGLSTGIGSCIAFVAKHTNKKFLSVSLGFSAGVMIYVSLVEILAKAKTSLAAELGERGGNWSTILAFFGGMLVIAVIDKLIPSEENPHEVRCLEKEKKKSGKLMRMGAFNYSFLSGLAEPLGALIGWLILLPIMNDIVYGVIFAGVAGIMVFISFDELLPAAQEYGEHHLSLYGLISGMGVMAVSLLLFL